MYLYLSRDKVNFEDFDKQLLMAGSLWGHEDRSAVKRDSDFIDRILVHEPPKFTLR